MKPLLDENIVAIIKMAAPEILAANNAQYKAVRAHTKKLARAMNRKHVNDFASLIEQEAEIWFYTGTSVASVIEALTEACEGFEKESRVDELKAELKELGVDHGT